MTDLDYLKVILNQDIIKNGDSFFTVNHLFVVIEQAQEMKERIEGDKK